jgi:hypothetical protein
MAEAMKVGTPTYTIELTEKEAEALVSLCGFVGGAPEGPRGLIDGISHVLSLVGVKEQVYKLSGSVHFIEGARR